MLNKCYFVTPNLGHFTYVNCRSRYLEIDRMALGYKTTTVCADLFICTCNISRQ